MTDNEDNGSSCLTKEVAVNTLNYYVDKYFPNPADQIPIRTVKMLKHVLKTEITDYHDYHQDHEKVRIEFNGHIESVDKNISKLIKLMWQCGIDVYDSCGDDTLHGYILIEFPVMFMLERFLRIVFEGIELENDIYQRACHSPKYVKNAWLYDQFFRDNGCQNDSDEDVTEINAVHNLKFPKKDKSWICRKLKECLIRYDYNIPDTYNYE